MQHFEVEFFEKADGTYPAEEFILSQEKKMPENEILLAKKYRAEYQLRKE